MKKYAILCIDEKKYLQNTNADTFKQNIGSLEYGATLVEDIGNATLFKDKDRAEYIIEEAMGKTSFRDSFFTIVTVYSR